LQPLSNKGQLLSHIAPGFPGRYTLLWIFGISAEVAVEAWEMMEELNCLSPLPQFEHYLWALAFMQLYPANNKALSIMLGGSDPKTIQKYIWPMIQSIFDLEGVVVSTANSPASFPSHLSPFLPDTI
jgi:hypothetical protein